MRLDHKVRFDEDRFSTLALSTGQRKRLAMVATIMEDRPIYMFDEWAADQDRGETGDTNINLNDSSWVIQ